MALTYSSMLELNSKIPHFKLKNVLDDKIYTSTSLSNEKPSLIMIICNHCPYVIHYHEELKRMNSDFGDTIDFIAINSNDIINYPQDGPELMTQHAKDNKYPFSYLYDENQEVAKAYKAACTPDFFVFDKNKELVYRGQLDDSRPGNDIPLNGKDIREVFESIINSRSITINQKPSIGCNIKWKN